MSRVFDCCLFNNEWAQLELRLHTLCDVVDGFVVVDAYATHSGSSRTSTAGEVLERFPEFDIHATTVGLPSPEPDRWFPERMQRNGIVDALRDGWNPHAGDIIMFSDVDEIPDPANVRHVGTHWQAAYMYYLNAYFHSDWPGTIGVPYEAFQYHTPSGLRAQNGTLPRIRGGWHFSYQGGLPAVQQKLRDFAHGEFDTPDAHAKVDAQMAKLSDPFARPGILEKGRIVPIDDTFPRYVREHQERFPGMIAPLDLVIAP